MSTDSGYSDQELQAGVHYIDYRGSIGASEEQVVEFWRRRASELCPSGYAILSEQGHALAGPTTNNVAGRITARARARCM